MRLLLILAAVAMSFPAGAQQKEKKPFDGPRLEVEPEEHDFGSAQQNQKLSHEFTVKNTGSEEVVIRRIATSCGCAAALVSEKTIAPGGSTTLVVTLETRKYRGVVQKSVSIASNDKRRVHTFHVKAFVEP